MAGGRKHKYGGGTGSCVQGQVHETFVPSTYQLRWFQALERKWNEWLREQAKVLRPVVREKAEQGSEGQND